MNKEEIREYLKRVEELENKLMGKDKDTYQWLVFGYNQCAKLLNETRQQIDQLTNNWRLLEEYIKFQRKVSLGLNNGYGVSLCDTFLDKMKEIKEKTNG